MNELLSDAMGEASTMAIIRRHCAEVGYEVEIGIVVQSILALETPSPGETALG